MEYYRTWCPDMTVAGLGEDSRSYLDLLVAIVEGEDGKIVPFPHSMVDAVLSREWGQGNISANETVETIVKKMKLDRTLFVTVLLLKIMLSFYNIDQTIRFRSPSHVAFDSHRHDLHAALSALKNGDSEQSEQCRDIKKALAARNAEEKGSCYGCGKTKAELPRNTVFQACSGCKKIKQTVLYCSRKCQKNDWKVGFAGLTPHKEECGKPWKMQVEDDLPSLSKALPGSATGSLLDIFPPANAGFRRSMALQYQIRLLTPSPGHYPDYVLVMDYPESPVEVIIPNPWIALTFIAIRTRAFQRGDPESVNVLYNILLSLSESYNMPTPNLKRQLEAEYGVDLDGAFGAPCAEPTGEETMNALNIILLTADRRGMDPLILSNFQKILSDDRTH
ncbi:hypothetical protein BXZ70DRAFT_369103 [Cristinia sonorae]|uniref:MYND-type domain-containing protein n=1 Tax=Cristinia sonorae TaxID=1940300 RepID=A0A8K0XMN5_9AGAR|nr:hypothetical protein BXZ70DRAFT_369103 [Cristinia sonorae]